MLHDDAHLQRAKLNRISGGRQRATCHAPRNTKRTTYDSTAPETGALRIALWAFHAFLSASSSVSAMWSATPLLDVCIAAPPSSCEAQTAFGI